MKIRNGFVSNSSSSSFCILGYYFDNEDELPADLNKTRLHTEFAISEGEDWAVVGLPPTEMQDDQTLLEFKQLIRDELAKVGVVIPTSSLEFITDGGWNG